MKPGKNTLLINRDETPPFHLSLELHLQIHYRFYQMSDIKFMVIFFFSVEIKMGLEYMFGTWYFPKKIRYKVWQCFEGWSRQLAGS